MEIKVAVVTPTIDSKHLKQCLESVNNQTYKNLTHYIFIDGCQYEPKVKELIKELKRYKDDTEVLFKIVAPEEVAEDDTKDIEITWYGEIGTSLLDNDEPRVEIGLQYANAEDWKTEWKADFDEYYNDERT